MLIDVLIIDDDDDIRGTLAELLQEEGYAVIALPDANDLVETLGRVRPRMMLLDLTLPGQDLGHTLADARQLDLLAETSVFALSGLDEADVIAQQLGLQGSVRKPFQIAELLQHVERICRRDRGLSQATDAHA